MKKRRFEITGEHVRLTRLMRVGWKYAGFGAPAINSEEPYGSVRPYVDIAKVLGIPSAGPGREFSDEQCNRMDEVHREMKTVLEIGLSTGEFKAGEYECDEACNRWKAV